MRGAVHMQITTSDIERPDLLCCTTRPPMIDFSAKLAVDKATGLHHPVGGVTA